LAALAGYSPAHSRAAGGALHHNPLPILLPCHRVIGSSGKLVGFNGGVDIKEVLLKLEKNNGFSEYSATKARVCKCLL